MDDSLWSSYELSLESVPDVPTERQSPGLASPLSEVAADTLMFNDFSLLDMGEIGFLTYDEMEKELQTLGEINTSQDNVLSEQMEISHWQNEDFRELFGSDFFRDTIENNSHLVEEDRQVLHPLGEERQEVSKSLSGEVMNSFEPESLYSCEVLECKICLKKCATPVELKEHYQTCYLEMRAVDETSIANLNAEEITINLPYSATCIIPDIVLDEFPSENITVSKTQLTLTHQKSIMNGKEQAEKVVDSSIDPNKLIPELFQYINISSKPVNKKATLKRSHKTVYVCSICSDIYEHKQPLLCHLKNHAKKSWNQCPCLPLTIKKLSPANTETYPCTFCARVFSKKSVQIEHQRIHEGKKPFTCDICLFSCTQSSNLKRHEKSHDGLLRPFACTTCSFKFATKSELDAHCCKHKRNSEKLLKKTSEKLLKNTCEKLLETVKKTESHTEKRAILNCSICLKKFMYKSLLRNHLRSHSNARPFQCSFCPKNYKFAGLLKTHMANHGKEMPHCCTFCEKRFYHPTKLKLHISRHHMPHQFLCMYCGEGFDKRACLLQHEATHIEEKPFTCGICGFSCTQQTNLKRHLKSHIGSAKPFSCVLCNHKFALEEELNIHAARHERKAKTSSKRIKQHYWD